MLLRAVVVVVVSHIQRIGCQPEKTTLLHGDQSRSWSAEQGKNEKRKSLAAPPSPPPRCSFGEKNNNNKKITRRIHMSRRYEGRRYAGGLGPSRVRTRIPTTRRLGQWVSLRKILRFRVRLQLSQSRCLSFLLAMSGRVVLFFPPRGHEPPPTLRDRLNPTCVYNHVVCMYVCRVCVLFFIKMCCVHYVILGATAVVVNNIGNAVRKERISAAILGSRWFSRECTVVSWRTPSEVRAVIMGGNTTPATTQYYYVCVCFLPIHSGHQVRWTYQPGSHRRKVTQDFSSTFFVRCVP